MSNTLVTRCETCGAEARPRTRIRDATAGRGVGSAPHAPFRAAMRSPSPLLHRLLAAPTTGLAALRAAASLAGTGLAAIALTAGATGCGGAATADPVKVATTPTATARAAGLQIATGYQQTATGYQTWSGEAPAKGCVVRDLAPPALCSGEARCPVVQSRLAVCEGGTSEVAVAGATVVFGLRAGGAEGGFAYWPARDGIHAFGAPGSDPRPALDDQGALRLVRVEQRRIVDYLVDGPALQKRVWESFPGNSDHLTNASWVSGSLFARFSRGYSSSSRDFVAAADGTFKSPDVSSPPGYWPYPVVPARTPGHSYAVLYGPSGVGIAADQAVWLVPSAVSRTAAERDVLVGASAKEAPVFAFKSFDSGETSGAHILFPRGPLVAAGKVGFTDVHLLAGRLTRTDDCPVGRGQADTKARPCTRIETDSQGSSLARTGDGRIWLAHVVTTREHRASAKVVCPPQPHCPRGMPCREVPCNVVESDVHDSVRHELRVVRLAPDGSGAELGIRLDLADIGGVDYVRMMDMDSVAQILHVALQTSDLKVLRLQLDTTSMRLTPLGPADVTVTPIELSPEK